MKSEKQQLFPALTAIAFTHLGGIGFSQEYIYEYIQILHFHLAIEEG